jgi:hypothetical protein
MILGIGHGQNVGAQNGGGALREEPSADPRHVGTQNRRFSEEPIVDRAQRTELLRRGRQADDLVLVGEVVAVPHAMVQILVLLDEQQRRRETPARS